jgi:hypothetical protein
MFSETDSILSKKDSDKFRERARALRRVSIILLLIALLKLSLVFFFWRDGSTGQTTLGTLQKSKWQNNYLSIFVACLAFGLMVQSVMGLYTAG